MHPSFCTTCPRRAPENAIITSDVGQHQMWVAQHCYFDDPKDHISSSGLGTMGFGVPAGLGSQLGCPRPHSYYRIRRWFDYDEYSRTRDFAPLSDTLKKLCYWITVCSAWCGSGKKCFLMKNYSEVDLYDNPDFAAVAKAFQIDAFTVTTRDQVDAGIDKLLAAKTPILMHVKISASEKCLAAGTTGDEAMQI